MNRPGPRCRPFRVGDGMILLSALGIGLGWLRSIHASSVLPRQVFNRRLYFGRSPAAVFHQWISVGRLFWPFAFVLSIAALAIRLRRPRPIRARLGRQPGFIASAAVALLAALFALECLLGWIVRRSLGIESIRTLDTFEKAIYFRPTTPCLIGLAVVASWATLRISGRWRNEPGWIDRLGRIIGLYWVLMFVVYAWFVLDIL